MAERQGENGKEAEEEKEKEKEENNGHQESSTESARENITEENENENENIEPTHPPQILASEEGSDEQSRLQHQRQQPQVSSIVVNTIPALIQLTPATPCTPLSPVAPMVLNPSQAFVRPTSNEINVKLQDTTSSSPFPHRQKSSTSSSCSTTPLTEPTHHKLQSSTNPPSSPVQFRRSQSEQPREPSLDSSRFNQFQTGYDSFGIDLDECPGEEEAFELSPMITSDAQAEVKKSACVPAGLPPVQAAQRQHPVSEYRGLPGSSGSVPCVNQLLLTRRLNSARVASGATNNIYSLGNTSSKVSDDARPLPSNGSSRGKRFWESSRRSLAKIISSATGPSTIAPQQTGRALSQTDVAARFSDTEQTTHHGFQEIGSVGMSSGETSRMSSCEPDSSAQQHHHHHHHQEEEQPRLQQTSYNPATITKQLINKAWDISRSHNGVCDDNQLTNSPITAQQPSGKKLKKPKVRALSCQQNLARHATSGAIMLPKNSLTSEQFNGSSRCTLNVGGVRHEVLWSTLLKIPKTRLWRLAYTACILLQSSVSNDLDSNNEQQQHLPSSSESRNQQPRYNRQQATHISQPHLSSLGMTTNCAGGPQQQAGYLSSIKKKRRFTLGSRAISTCSGQMASTSLYQHPQQQHVAQTQSSTNKESMRSTTGSQQVPITSGNCQSVNNITSPSSTSTRYPKSLICKSILQYCDDFNLTTNEFFFDRQPRSFICILDYYRTGKLHLSEDLCVMAFKEDLDYWEIDDYNLDSCCQQRYHQRRDNVFEEMKKEMESLKEHDEELFGTSQLQRYQKFVWDLLEKPQTSLAARVSMIGG